MEIALVFIIVLLIGYSIFKDISFQKERKDLQLKWMSRDVDEYIRASEKTEEEDTKEEESPFVPIEEATIDQILKSKDRL